MPRGKPFICWLANEKFVNTWPLYQGDEVLFDLDGNWVKGIIRCLKGTYVVCMGKKKYPVFMTIQLKAIKQSENSNGE